MARHTLIVQVIEDTYVDKLNPNTNYGTSAEIKMGGPSAYNNTIGGWEYEEKTALFKWVDPTIPARKKFISRYLYVYATSKLTAPYCSPMIHEAGLPFSEASATWNNLLNGRVADSAIGTSISEDKQNEYVGFNISYNSNGYATVYVTSLNDAVFTFQSRHAANPPYVEIVYEDVPPNAPTPTAPIGNYKDSKKAIRFEWQYNSDVGGIQKKFDLQWSTDKINWTTISQTTGNTYYDMPSNTLPTGNIYWRVRCYNEYDETGDYCAIQSFYAIGAPEAPHINAVPAATARPVVSWSAFGQQSYQLQIISCNNVIYDSGAIPHASERQHKIKSWLADGSYIVKLRIMNEYGLWSEWGSTLIAISTAKPVRPIISVQPSEYGAELNISGTAEYYMIYRNGICIGKTISSTYIDNTVQSGKEYIYYIRAISTLETYQDSDCRLFQCSLRHTTIAPVSDLTNIICCARTLNTPPKRTYSSTTGGTYVIYAGRRRPVWEPTDNISAGMTMSYYLKAWPEVEKLIAMYEQNTTVLYRDSKGRKIYGVLGNLSVSDERLGYTASFIVNEVDYDEEVEV